MTRDKMKFYYQNGLWSIDRLNKLLSAGKITPEDYDYIISDDE